MAQAVCFGKRADDAAGDAGGQRVCGDVARHDAARADDAVVADRDARADGNPRGEPAVVADAYRSGVAEVFFLAGGGHHGPALVRQKRVQRRDDGHVRPEIAVVTDGHVRVVLNRQVEVGEKSFADVRMLAVMEKDRPLQEPAAERAEYLG